MARYCLPVLISAALLAQPAVAGDPKPFPEFTFKRVGVPKAGTVRRITVQIEPAPDPPPAEERSEAETEKVAEVTGSAAPVTTAGLAYDWYWSAVSPAIGATVHDRFETAVLQLNEGPGVATPRLQHMQRIAERYGIDILAATIGTKVSPALVLAVIGIESAGRPNAVSSAGAVGLMQLIPDTAKRFGVTDSTDPAQNIRGGVAYLDWLMGEFGGDPILVLAAYNAGEGAVRKHAGVPPYNETRAYVPKVLAAWTVARGLCLTPPQLVSDGCVFAVREARRDG